MRRKRIRSGCPRSLRSGVIARVATIRRMAQSPVKWVMVSSGFGPRSCCQKIHASQRNGAKQSRKTTSFAQRLRSMSIVLLQVHSGIEAGDLLSVPVEHLGRMVFEQRRQALLGGL